MRAERVARKQHLVFGQIRVHAVRPVQVGRADETQRLATQIQAVAVFDGLLRERLVHDVGQITQGRTAGNHRRLRADFQQFHERTAMVGFRMVQHEVVDVGRIDERFDFFKVFVPKRHLGRLYQGRFLAASYQIRVIGRAVFGLHNHIERHDIEVQNADPVHTGGDVFHFTVFHIICCLKFLKFKRKLFRHHIVPAFHTVCRSAFNRRFSRSRGGRQAFPQLGLIVGFLFRGLQPFHFLDRLA